MVTIIIKSFNRPHYLDRCLTSISENVKGDYIIKIVDDGTPQKYLKKIQEKFPQVEFVYTKGYLEKSAQINAHESVTRSIPSKDWYDAVQNSTDYVLVIEDDVWFTSNINITKLAEMMPENNIYLLRLGWNGISNGEQITQINDLIVKEKFSVFSLNERLISLLFSNKYNFFSVLKKMKIVDSSEFFKYYHFISISSGLHKKEYWLKTWENMPNTVNEKKQIKNAISYYKKNKTNNFISRLEHEIIKTTFKSSATNSGHNYGCDFDVNAFNYILNEAWYNGNFDSMQNYPEDFSDDYIVSFLDKENNPHSQFEEWKKWAEKFKEQYRNLGAQVD